MFRLTLSTDGAAFAEDGQVEVARILRYLADQLDLYPEYDAGAVRDINGNTVGEWEMRP